MQSDKNSYATYRAFQLWVNKKITSEELVEFFISLEEKLESLERELDALKSANDSRL